MLKSLEKIYTKKIYRNIWGRGRGSFGKPKLVSKQDTIF